MKSGCWIADYLSEADVYDKNYIPEKQFRWWLDISTDVIHQTHRPQIIRRLKANKEDYINKISETETLGELGEVYRSDTN